MTRPSDDGPEPGSARRERYVPRGREPWPSVDALVKDPGLGDALRSEFPPPPGAAADWSRRSFLRLMGASMALAGLAGCGRGVGLPGGRSRLLPYVRPPEEGIPGRPSYYATTLACAGDVMGALGETHLGRPTKLEGNPDHPASLGAGDLFLQAAVLELYDPARCRSAFAGGLAREPQAFRDFLLERRAAALPKRGEGLRLLTGEIRSPSLSAQVTSLLREMPEARWHVHEPVGNAGARRGSELAFGRPLQAVPRLDKARVVVAFGADPFGWGPMRVRSMRDWAAGRALRTDPPGDMGRWYAAESHPTLSGAAADHRLRAAPSRLPALLSALGAALGAGTDAGPRLAPQERDWIAAAARDLRENAGRGLVLAGESLPPGSHALAHALNDRLGNVGVTVTFVEPMPAESGAGSLEELVADMRAGRVEALLILESNPAHTAPADLGWETALERVPQSASLAFHRDETARRCGWQAPLAHPLETWGDLRAWDGTVSLAQPLIGPLVQAWTPSMALAVLAGDADPDPHALVREHWLPLLGGDEARWREALRKGVLEAGRAIEPPKIRPEASAGPAPDAPPAPGLEIEFRPDPTVWDGRYAFHPWLQETPKPFSALAWDNAAYMSRATADALRLASRDEVELRFRGRSVTAPVWILPGQADGVVTVHLGYGRVWPGPRLWLEGEGSLPGPGDDRREVFGFDAYALRARDALWSGAGLEIRKTGNTVALACRQEQARQDDRRIVRAIDLARLRQDPAFCAEPEPASLYPDRPYEGSAWGMAIDLSLCTGCSACVVACRAENNVPVVGKEGLLRGRDMAWLRIDRYFLGPSEAPVTAFQPMLCQQCEHAPCEVVCPVEATQHDSEGLNGMIYNRCVGTRYCSNNCPYKVRRFNFFDYARAQDAAAAPQRNPDVTVRGRGVMEKCSFCVQRINAARIEARKQDRPIRDGEAVTACMQACPTGAIAFGDLNDPGSKVRALRRLPWNYAVLGELGTRPRIRYLARVGNPDPALPADAERMRA